MSGNSNEYGPKPGWRFMRTILTYRRIIWILLIIVFLISFFDLAGWIFNIGLFKSITPKWESMEFITSLCFIVSALTLVIIQLNFSAFIKRTLSISLAFVISIIGLTTLYVYLFYLDTGHESSITQLSSLSLYLSPVSRMDILTTVNFILVGCILFLFASEKERSSGIAHIITVPVFLISYLSIISYVLDVYSSTELRNISFAVNTAIAFCGICSAVLLMKPETWLMKLFNSRDTAGIISRKLFPALVVLPVLIGWLRIRGERMGLIKSEEGIALVAIAYVFCFMILIWLTARSIDKIDRNRRSTEEALRESEERFRTIAESLPVLICIYNIKDSAFSFVNEQFEKTFGFYKSELITRKLPVSFFNSEDRKDLGNLLKEKGRAYNKEIRVKKADGTPFWIMSSTRRILFMNEPSYLSAAIDISESKKTQMELVRLNRTLDAKSTSSHVMMHSRNEFGYLDEVCKIIIKDCGHAMVWVGYAQNDKKKSVKPVAYHGFDKGYIDQMNISWDDNEQGRGPTGTTIRTGKPSLCRNMLTDPLFKPWREAALERGYSSSLVLPLISEGKTFGAISIYSKEPDPFSDSEIKLLSDLADDLAYGISYIRLVNSERAAAKVIKENEAKLKELVATKDKFFNIVAHDLKNPFTSLLGSSELLFENIDHMNISNIKDLAMILNDSAKGGYAILQNLLDWSRSQTGLIKFNPEKINLKELINENLSSMRLPAANKEINLYSDVEDDIYIFTDKNMINTILRNLLSNAIKFTRKNGNVSVKKEVTTSEVILSVKDTGVGIPEEKMKDLFNIETKNSLPGTENEQGTGLGLKLSKEFVEKLDGRIWVESEVDKGSEFKFAIPMKGTKDLKYQ
jgi:PAS domain S-box-containing protein